MSTAGAAPEAPAPSPRRRRGHRRWWRRHPRIVRSVAVLAAIVGLGGVALAVRYLPLLDDARGVRTDLQAVVDRVHASGMDVDRGALDAIQAALDDADGRVRHLDDVLAHDPVVALARWFGPTSVNVRAGDDLVLAASQLMAAAHDVMSVGRQYVDIRAAHAADPAAHPALSGLIELMAGSDAPAADARSHVDAATVALARVPDTGLMSQLASVRDLMRSKLDEYAPLLDAYVRADTVVPRLLGWGGATRYLVLAEDPAELRPTGGFPGTYGMVGFTDGKISELSFSDIGPLDGTEGVPYVEPPAALRDHLLGPGHSWQLSEANWSPDFPSTAEESKKLYTLESGDGDVDGVVALTTYAIDRLLEVTGPVTVPGYDVTVAAGETTQVALEQTRAAPAPGVNRKAFLGAFAETILNEVLQLPPASWPRLVDALNLIRTERRAAVWVTDDQGQALVAESGWDGSVRQDEGDFVMPVDTDVAPASKYAIAIDRFLRLDISIDSLGNADTTATQAWVSHVGEGGSLDATLRHASNSDIYGTFYRLLVPQRSRLVAASGGAYVPITDPETIESEAGRTAFGNYLMVPPGHAELVYRWISPYAASMEADGVTGLYRLTVQKQMGTIDDALFVTISLPPGARVLSSTPGLTVDGGTVTIATRLVADVQLEVMYTLAP